VSPSTQARLGRIAEKDALLEAALDHVPFDGWSRQTLQAAARDRGLDPANARRLFPGGGDDLLAWLEDWADRRMLLRLADLDLPALRVRERIAAMVRARLEVLAPHREAVRRALAARMLPHNAIAATRALWRTVDRMWDAAGDGQGGGFGHYSRRALLSGVWSATLLFWLEDPSEDQIESWAFLDRRIEDVMRLGRLGARLESFFPWPGRSAAR
jgi:ubiquinone biosynthesis protein COQ9